MKYLIIGAGAIGSTLAAYLARSGTDVTLMARGENLRVIRQNGLSIRSLTEDDFVQSVRVVAEDEYRDSPDVVIVCVKAYALDTVLPFLDRVTHPDTIVFPVLNALDMGKRIADRLSHDVVPIDGVAYVAVKQTAPGEVLKKLDFFRIVLGPSRGQASSPRLNEMVRDLEAAGMEAEISDNMLKSTLRKFMRVSTLSAAEVYFDTDAAGVRSHPESWEFLKQLGSDISQIAAAAGVPIEGDPVAVMLDDVANVNGDYLTSLMYDVRNGHTAEFDTQFFDVYDLGRSLGLEVPAYARISAKLGHQPAIEQSSTAGQTGLTKEKGNNVTLENNKRMVVDFYSALERGDYDSAAKMCHPDFIFYNQIDTPLPGVDGFIEAEKKHLDCYEGFTMKVDTVAEGDRVAAYVDFEGPHTGTFYGLEPTGLRLHMSMLNLFTVKDGKFIEKRAHYDRYDHLIQLGWQPA